MATMAYAIRSTDGNVELINIVAKGEKTGTMVYVSPTNVAEEFLACTAEGDIIGHRHESVDAVLEYISRRRGLRFIQVNAAHPVARQFA
jgi:hypothetical protein